MQAARIQILEFVQNQWHLRGEWGTTVSVWANWRSRVKVKRIRWRLRTQRKVLIFSSSSWMKRKSRRIMSFRGKFKITSNFWICTSSKLRHWKTSISLKINLPGSLFLTKQKCLNSRNIGKELRILYFQA